jgi:hypothetical protein
MKHSLASALATLILFFPIGVAFADTANLDATRDAPVSQASPSTNYGSNNSLIIGDFSGQDWEAFCQFDLSGIPSNANVTSVGLRFYWGASKISGTMRLRRPSSSWSEGSITWSNKPSSTSLGDYSVTAGSSSRFTLDLSGSALQYVKDIVSGSTSNRGFHVQWPSAPTNSYFSLRARESGDEPRLIVEYEIPPPPDPELAGSTPDLSFVLEVGASDTKPDAWRITNVGPDGSTLTYNLEKVRVSPAGGNCNWLSISPSSGSLTNPSGPTFPSDEIDFTANATGLTPGTTYTCTVNVTCNDPANPGPFPSTITLTVDPPPGPDWDITNADSIDLPPFEPGQYPEFSVTVRNIGNQPAPASKLKAEAEDRDTGNDFYEALIDVPVLAVNESVTLQVPVRVGAYTEILVPKFTANAENLPERDPANNESGILLAVTEKSRIQGNTEKKTGFSGDPVNTATGNFVHHSTDLAIPARIADFRFTRFYNSQSDEVGPLGRGWRHTFMYSMDLSDTTKPGVIYPDGHSEYWSESGGSYDPLFPQIFTRLEKVGANWRATTKDLMVINFDSNGRCTDYADKNGNTVTLGYSGSNLTSVTDPAGQSHNRDRYKEPKHRPPL